MPGLIVNEISETDDIKATKDYLKSAAISNQQVLEKPLNMRLYFVTNSSKKVQTLVVISCKYNGTTDERKYT